MLQSGNATAGTGACSGVVQLIQQVMVKMMEQLQQVLRQFLILKLQLKKYIGAYAAEMNGLDAVVFTAGIGENNPHLREIVCEDMEYFGIKINKELNAKMLRQSNIVKLSTDDSKVAVYLIPTNEELLIARDTAALVSAKG